MFKEIAVYFVVASMVFGWAMLIAVTKEEKQTEFSKPFDRDSDVAELIEQLREYPEDHKFHSQDNLTTGQMIKNLEKLVEDGHPSPTFLYPETEITGSELSP